MIYIIYMVKWWRRRRLRRSDDRRQSRERERDREGLVSWNDESVERESIKREEVRSQHYMIDCSTSILDFIENSLCTRVFIFFHFFFFFNFIFFSFLEQKKKKEKREKERKREREDEWQQLVPRWNSRLRRPVWFGSVENWQRLTNDFHWGDREEKACRCLGSRAAIVSSSSDGGFLVSRARRRTQQRDRFQDQDDRRSGRCLDFVATVDVKARRRKLQIGDTTDFHPSGTLMAHYPNQFPFLFDSYPFPL